MARSPSKKPRACGFHGKATRCDMCYFIEAIIARAKRNVAAGLALDEGGTPQATSIRFRKEPSR